MNDKNTSLQGSRAECVPLPRAHQNAAHRYAITVLVTAVAVLLAIPTLQAGDYILMKGRGVGVCERYAKNLNSFSHLSYPMACDRKLNPEFDGFKKPTWETLDVWSHRQLLRDIEHFLQLGWAKRESDYESWVKDLKRRIQDGHVHLLSTNVDIDNDGKKDNVLKYVNGSCTGTHFYATPLLVVNSDGSALDVAKTSYLLQNPSAGGNSDAGRWGYTMYDVFIYSDESYFDRWSEQTDQKGILKVFQTRNNQTQELCSYRYGTSK